MGSKAGMVVYAKQITTLTYNGSAIADYTKVKLPDREGADIDLTTADDAVSTGKLGAIVKYGDLTVTKRFDSSDASRAIGITGTGTLVVGYSTLGNTAKTETYQAELKQVVAASLETAPGEGATIDLVFKITNLNASYAVTAPAFA